MNKLLIILGLVIALVLGVFVISRGCKQTSTFPPEKLEDKTLSFWGVWDDSEDFEEIIGDFQAHYPNVQIKYRKLKPEEYENALIEAWAAGIGPDIFMVHNSWTRGYQKYLVTMPESIQMAKRTISNNVFGKEEVSWSLETIEFPSNDTITTSYVDVVADNVIIDNEVCGLPLSVDTLALYYNKDLLANENIIFPPTIWQEFAANEYTMVPKLTKQDEAGDIVQAGTALGTSSNIDRAVDILSLIMMQFGTEMIDKSANKVVFDKATDEKAVGQSALEYYTDFASPEKVAYTWNDNIPDALELFIRGQLAFMFGYSYHLNSIEQRGGQLNYDIAPMLHINPDGTDNNPYGSVPKKINYANYWVLSAYKESDWTEEAWAFIHFAAMRKDANNKYEALKYLDKTKKPGALKEIINLQQNDPQLNVFASQALSAQSWYTGYDGKAVEIYFANMIDNVVSGKASPTQALKLAAEQVQKTLAVNQ